MFRTILLAYDGTAVADEALTLSIDLVRSLQADMHIVSVVDDGSTSATDGEGDRRFAWQRLRNAEELAWRAGLTVRLEVLDGDAAVQIVEHARRVVADIIVLGHTRAKHPALPRGGSVAEFVRTHAPCAVLMLPLTSRGSETSDNS